MTLKRYVKIVIIVLLTVGTVILVTCEKPERIVNFKTLDVQADDISYTSVILKGEITDLGSKAIEQHGFILSESSFPELGQQSSIEKPLGPATSKGIFQAQFTGLKSNVTYYFRSFVVIESASRVSVIKQFTTKDAIPAATTEAATSISSTSATLEGRVNAKDLSTTVTFEYGLTTEYGSVVTAEENLITDNSVASLNAHINNLTASTTYHFRVKAVNEVGITYGSDMSFSTPETLLDDDDNVYNVVIIGNQWWMQKNLKTTKFNDYSDIPLVTDNTAWADLTTPGFCYYNNDADNNKDLYGALYNWHAVNSEKLCPIGWHVVSDGGWSVLTDYLGGETSAGGKLKEADNEHWDSPNTEATDETGFTALPGGYRDGSNGEFYDIGQSCISWSSTENSSIDAWRRSIHYDNSSVVRSYDLKSSGFSVRCVKGELPYAETNSVDALTSTSVTLNGIINPKGSDTEVTFEYGTTISYGSSITADQSPVSGSESVFVRAYPESLTPRTTYHYRLKAVNSAGIIYGDDMEFTTPDQVTDIDGNIYNTLIIGTQIWMNENLKTTRFNDDTEIPLVTERVSWEGLLTPGYCWYNNEQITYANEYGALYNWYTVNTGKLCPESWHMPTDEEWTILTDAGTIDETGFRAHFGGRRNGDDGEYEQIHVTGNWWSSTEFTSQYAFSRFIYNPPVLLERDFRNKDYGMSVRCIKD